MMPYRDNLNSRYSTLRGMNGYVGRQHSIQFPSRNLYRFPDIQGYSGPVPKKLIPYNELSKYKHEDISECAVHFYMCDSKFESVWTYPTRTMDKLRESGVGMVIGPDFSMFPEWPLAVNLYNKYRSHWCMALWEKEGFKVIPNVGWIDGQPKWFDGFRTLSTLAISTVGANPVEFSAGFQTMMDCLIPKSIIVYGRVFPEIRFTADKCETQVVSFNDKWKEVKR